MPVEPPRGPYVRGPESGSKGDGSEEARRRRSRVRTVLGTRDSTFSARAYRPRSRCFSHCGQNCKKKRQTIRMVAYQAVRPSSNFERTGLWTSLRGSRGAVALPVLRGWSTTAQTMTALGGGSLGSCVDEERSQLRELM